MKIKNFTKIFLFVAVAALFSCSSSSDGGSGDGDGNGDGNGVTSVSVTASAQFVNFGDAISFTVKTNEGTDVTSSSTIVVDNQNIDGTSFTATATGEYAIKAIYEDLTSASISVTVLPVLVAITIETAQATYNLGDRIDYIVSAVDNDGNATEITSIATVFVDGAESFSGSTVIPGTTGTIEAYATFEAFTSSTQMVTVEDNATTPSSFNRKALIEDYTGDWCGYCTRVAVAIELCQEASDDVVVIATHLFNGDPYQNSFGLQMADALNITGLPTAYVNRAAEWSFPETSNVNQVTNLASGSTQNGIAINSAIKGNNLSFMVSAGFGQSVSGAQLVVVLLENGLILDQRNYYPEYYGGDDPVQNFVHDHVLRHSFTSILGDAVPAGQASANNTYRVKYDYVVPSTLVESASKLEIVAMLLNPNGVIINVNVAKAGEFSDFN